MLINAYVTYRDANGNCEEVEVQGNPHEVSSLEEACELFAEGVPDVAFLLPIGVRILIADC